VQEKPIFKGGIPELPIKVFAGGAHLGCVTFEGNAFTWGVGTNGQLGTGTFLHSENPKRVRTPQALKVVDAHAGEEHTVFTVVKEGLFAQLLPKIMMNEIIPAAIAEQSLPPNITPTRELDLKF
jgi:alpha-tubulin suppressor-like RCC1 family protein